MKHSKRPVIAKRYLSAKKVVYAIFYGAGVAIKLPVKTHLKKLKKYYQKRRPATGFNHVRLLHDNAHAHISAIVTAFLKKEKKAVSPSPHAPPPPPYFPHLASCDFVSEIEIIPFWAEIPVPVPYYCAQIQISVP